MLKGFIGVVGLAVVGTGFAVAWQGIQLMGYEGPGLGAGLTFVGLAVVILALLESKPLRRWRRAPLTAGKRAMYALMVVVAVGVPVGLWAFAPERVDKAPPRAKFQDVCTVEMINGPAADPDKEKCELDGAGVLTLRPPENPTTEASLALTIFSESQVRGNVMDTRLYTTETLTLRRGGPAQMVKTRGRSFSVSLESIFIRDRAPGRSQSFRYTFRIREQ